MGQPAGPKPERLKPGWGFFGAKLDQKRSKNGAGTGPKRFVLVKKWGPKTDSVSRPTLVPSGVVLGSLSGSVLAPFCDRILGPFSDAYGMLLGSVLECQKGPWKSVGGGVPEPKSPPVMD